MTAILAFGWVGHPYHSNAISLSKGRVRPYPARNGAAGRTKGTVTMADYPTPGEAQNILETLAFQGFPDENGPSRFRVVKKGKIAFRVSVHAAPLKEFSGILNESFCQLWSYDKEGWALKFFDNWKASLKWQRLPAFEKFAAIIEKAKANVTSSNHRG